MSAKPKGVVRGGTMSKTETQKGKQSEQNTWDHLSKRGQRGGGMGGKDDAKPQENRQLKKGEKQMAKDFSLQIGKGRKASAQQKEEPG